LDKFSEITLHTICVGQENEVSEIRIHIYCTDSLTDPHFRKYLIGFLTNGFRGLPQSFQE